MTTENDDRLRGSKIVKNWEMEVILWNFKEMKTLMLAMEPQNLPECHHIEVLPI